LLICAGDERKRPRFTEAIKASVGARGVALDASDYLCRTELMPSTVTGSSDVPDPDTKGNRMRPNDLRSKWENGLPWSMPGLHSQRLCRRGSGSPGL
jgi:hypothetical protein